jgi:nitrite reductase (NO-forming)
MTGASPRGEGAGARCRRAPRPAPAAGGLRPSDLLALFFAAGIGFMLAGAVVAAVSAATGWGHGHWLALHLIFVGGISQLVLGAGQFFAGAFLATDPPSRRLVRVQFATWNAGTLLVAAGVPGDVAAATIAGAVLLAAGLVGFLAGLDGLRRRSLQRVPWALRWYQACAGCLGAGVLAGVLLATHAYWPWGSLVGAHMALNLAGWFGTAIVGTLHTFFPSLTQTQLRFARLQRPTFAAWTLGVAALATGFGFAVKPLVLAGWLALILAAALLCANLVASLRATSAGLSLPARLLTLAQGCLVLGLVVALADALTGSALAPPLDSTRVALAALLLPGWLGLTVLGSLLHLLAVLARVRDFRQPLPAARPARDRVLVAIAAAGVVGVAVARSQELALLDAAATAALLASYGALGALVLSRAARALRARPPGLRLR